MPDEWIVATFDADNDAAWDAVETALANLCGDDCPDCISNPPENSSTLLRYDGCSSESGVTSAQNEDTP